MEGPLIKAEPEEVIVTTYFWDFLPGKTYRLGIGTSGTGLENAKLELLKGDIPRSNPQRSFVQGFAENWFEVEKVKVEGFYLSPDDYPEPGEQLILRVTIPRGDLEGINDLYIVLSQQFGPKVWYLVDGCEVDESYW